MFRRTPPRPLRPTVRNPVGLTTRFSGSYPMNVAEAARGGLRLACVCVCERELCVCVRERVSVCVRERDGERVSEVCALRVLLLLPDTGLERRSLKAQTFLQELSSCGWSVVLVIRTGVYLMWFPHHPHHFQVALYLPT